MELREKETPRPPMPPARLDAVIVGAGPYGLSAAAHLRGRGLNVAVFGKPLELWHENMPQGMLLRSRWWAANLSDPGRRFTFAEFFRDSGVRPIYPVPLDTFLEYGHWFQRQAVPEVDETYVASVARRDGGFLVTLADGRRAETAAVVMATGLRYYAHEPDEFRGLTPDLVSHSSNLRDLTRFRNRRVVVIGGGQSAVEYAALLREIGASVELVSRHPIVWLEPDRSGQRGIAEQIRAPDAGIGPGWGNWFIEHMPYLFYHLPPSWKERAMVRYSGAWAADWLRPRIAGKVNVREGRTVMSCAAHDGEVDLRLSDGTAIRADHVVLATGYRVDVGKIPLFSPELRAEIKAERGVPVLTASFESTVPGLYFIGATSMRSFGPMFRFVLGCRAAARRVAQSIARGQRTRPKGSAVSREERRGRGLFHSEGRTAPKRPSPADEGPEA